MGSSAILSSAARKKRDANRRTIGEYQSSKVATVATTMRRDVAEFTQKERKKVVERLDKTTPHSKTATPSASHPQPRPTPDASLYRRPSI